ncbi:cyclopropane-fatty-acyl-phospholipid synthase [Robbsia sp. Bb-Pol-6]|uniref:Cyclopropane-fatty-acyl-phospholipid synthase n=1 Tax=Robbsia betulipollinis TaxID=2981849 RepID=A0ABT3ZHW6_9BURK|nr:cyclopropane-fatty-acyl-phospholipid synthase family protein [Robbsia betulipollinis]MCY0385952.1 cyclopropane-fatty-acyl-phospholipid synthase [Robbsia betulipollinis]
MNPIAPMIRMAERLPLTDPMTLSGIQFLVGKTARRLAQGGAAADFAFIQAMQRFPIAVHTEDANRQHYELPPAFFALMLGERRKYSCCLYGEEEALACAPEVASISLDDAERAALRATCAHAALADGQRILELGCGWGSLTLWMAQQYPGARITAVSNSQAQRAYIEDRCRADGLDNVQVVTADMNDFAVASDAPRFDRVVSVEMFEHMANWQLLLARVRDWLLPDGKLFLHVFTHRGAPYRFDHNDPSDWIAQHFFTGGLMPSERMIEQFGDLFTLEQEWRWNGTHYARTAGDWLRNFDRHGSEIDAILATVYGRDARLWKRRWRLFLLSTIGLFGHRQGADWGVSHYSLRPFPGINRRF